MVEWTNEGRAAITDIFSNLDYDRVTAESLERCLSCTPGPREHIPGADRAALKKLHVNPDNFKLLADVLTVVVAGRMGNNFTPEYQASFQRFLSVVVSALCRPYH
ncbi:hypothetical protein J4Q44_G00277780 [Coregonus suidteri]|uniref:Globin domain-containing protein n=1 Tax=Coregonus suidteri TaxID=861788 RepID=A0AAN8L572_9TELE